jgi:hypothetical protein
LDKKLPALSFALTVSWEVGRGTEKFTVLFSDVESVLNATSAKLPEYRQRALSASTGLSPSLYWPPTSVREYPPVGEVRVWIQTPLATEYAPTSPSVTGRPSLRVIVPLTVLFAGRFVGGGGAVVVDVVVVVVV